MKHRNKAEWWLGKQVHLVLILIIWILLHLFAACVLTVFSKLFLKGNIRATLMRDTSCSLLYNELLNPFELQMNYMRARLNSF